VVCIVRHLRNLTTGSDGALTDKWPLVASFVVLRSFLDGAVFGTTSGEGPPRVLLLHGWRRTHEDFAAVARELAGSGAASLACDLPGFGASPPPPSSSGARGYATTLEPLVDELAVHGPVLVVGHSFGGRVAVCLGAARPDAIAGLVLTGVPLVRDAMPYASPSWRYRTVRTLARWHVLSPGTLEAARRRHGSEDYRVATGVMRDVLVANVAESYEAELAAMRRPVTLLWGSRDATTPITVARAALELCATATLEVLDGVGHLVPTEAPGPLAASAATMLEGVR
jgi:pimeloyl-ACP methyl ester carboxylesterase